MLISILGSLSYILYVLESHVAVTVTLDVRSVYTSCIFKLYQIFSSLKCTVPFVGNGVVCGRDSDGDGYADMKLDCDDPQCEQVGFCIDRWQYEQLYDLMYLFIGYLCYYIQP